MIVAFMMQGLIGMAQRNNAKGDKYFNQNQFDQALKYYLFDSKARKRKVSEYAQLKVADCYRIMGEFDKAEEAYKKIQKRKKKDPTSYLNYGLSLKSSSKYAEAKVQFQEYITLNPSDLRGPLFLASCDSAQEWLDETIGREVKNIEKINTVNSEFSPFIYNNELYFASSRPGSKSALISFDGGNLIHRLDIYHTSIYDLNNSEHKEIHNLSTINTATHEGSLCFTKDGRDLYFTKTVKGKGATKIANVVVSTLQVYHSHNDGFGSWSKPESAFSFNSNNYSVGHPALSLDEKTMYFMSDMPGGYGKTDIYSSEKQIDGTWGKPKNLGNSVNTFGYELFPQITAKGRLYYSSDTHPGMGQLDVFFSECNDNKWTPAINAKPPINSIGNDFGICFDGASYRGFISSDRFNGKGTEDIYSFSDDIPLTISFMNDSILFEDKMIFDDIKYKWTNVTDSLTEDLVSKKGVYTLKPLSGKEYKLVARKNGMVFNNIVIKSSSADHSTNVEVYSTTLSFLINGKVDARNRSQEKQYSALCFYDSSLVVKKIYVDSTNTFNFSDTIAPNNKYTVIANYNPDVKQNSKKVILNGVVIDNIKLVKNATVLLNDNSGSIVAELRLNDNGFFDYTFIAEDNKQYYLKVLATDYEPKFVPLKLDNEVNSLNLSIDFSIK